MPLKSGIETILHRKFINFSFKAQNSHTGLVNIQRYLNTHHNKKRNSVSEQITNKNIEN